MPRLIRYCGTARPRSACPGAALRIRVVLLSAVRDYMC
jgi:hypothetical protein